MNLWSVQLLNISIYFLKDYFGLFIFMKSCYTTFEDLDLKLLSLEKNLSFVSRQENSIFIDFCFLLEMIQRIFWRSNDTKSYLWKQPNIVTISKYFHDNILVSVFLFEVGKYTWEYLVSLFFLIVITLLFEAQPAMRWYSDSLYLNKTPKQATKSHLQILKC